MSADDRLPARPLSQILGDAARTGSRPDLAELIAAIPYARYLGIVVERKGTEITTVLRFGQHLIGNPVLPALHADAWLEEHDRPSATLRGHFVLPIGD